MSFNIKTKKILSEENCKRIIQLGISIRDQLENAEKGFISEYDSTQTYTRGMSCYHDDYLWECMYTTTGDFDSSKWKQIGDKLTLVELDELKTMLNLTSEQLDSLQNLISTEIRLDKCFSSSDTYNRLLTVENECKKFTLEQLAKKAGVVYKVVADTTGVDSTEFLYLISNGSNGYNIYAYIDGSAVKISDTNINLDDYAKLSDLNNYYDKSTSDGKFATITTVDGKVDKTSILSTISSTPSDDKLLSEKAIKSELDNLKTNFQNGVDTVYDAVVAKGTTPVDKTPSEIADAISKLGGDLTSIYNALTNKGLNMSGTESDDQIASIITDLMTIKSFTSKTDSTTFVFNGTKDTIKDTELVDTSSGLKLEFSSKELTSVESGGYIEFAEIDKAEYNNRLKFV